MPYATVEKSQNVSISTGDGGGGVIGAIPIEYLAVGGILAAIGVVAILLTGPERRGKKR